MGVATNVVPKVFFWGGPFTSPVGKETRGILKECVSFPEIVIAVVALSTEFYVCKNIKLRVGKTQAFPKTPPILQNSGSNILEKFPCRRRRGPEAELVKL